MTHRVSTGHVASCGPMWSAGLLLGGSHTGTWNSPLKRGWIYRGALWSLSVRPLFLPCPLSVLQEEITYNLETSGAFSSFSSTIKCQVEVKHNTSPSSRAAIQPTGTKISLQSHRGWSYRKPSWGHASETFSLAEENLMEMKCPFTSTARPLSCLALTGLEDAEELVPAATL